MNDKLDLLEGVPLFSGVSREGLEELGAIADELEVPAGTALTHEGYREGFFFIVVEGAVRIERHGVLINTLGPGDYLGEIALLDGGATDRHGNDRDAMPPPVADVRDVPRAARRFAVDPDRHPRGGRPASPRAGRRGAGLTA